MKTYNLRVRILRGLKIAYLSIYQIYRGRKKVVKFVITIITNQLRPLTIYISINYLIKIARKIRNRGESRAREEITIYELC